MRQTLLELDKIRIDGGTQPRAAIDQAVVDDYAASIKDGEEFPAVTVFGDGANYWLADGYHRYHGHRKAGKSSIQAIVHRGTQRDAILWSVGANAEHGLRRSNDDKRKAVETLLQDPEWSGWTDREIARRCRVGHHLVGSVRSAMTSTYGASGRAPRCAEPKTRTAERGGKRYQMAVKQPSYDWEAAATSGESEAVPEAPEAKPEPEQDSPTRDQVGREIKDDKLREIFGRRQEITDLMTAVSRVKTAVERAVKAKDALYAHILLSRVQAEASNLYDALKFARPHAVCPYCGGLGCRACSGVGFVGQIQFERFTPEELKR